MELIIILSHGSRSKNSNVLTEKVAKKVSETLNIKAAIANLQLSPPYLEDVVEQAYQEGVRSFIIHPFFLHKGVHVEEDIPNTINSLQQRYDDAKFTLTDVTGNSSLVIDAVIETVRGNL